MWCPCLETNDVYQTKMTLSKQLHGLANNLFDKLTDAFDEVDFQHWVNANIMSPESLKRIQTRIDEAFAPTISLWKYVPPVVKVLTDAKISLQLGAMIACEVPCPHDPVEFLDKIQGNILMCYLRNWRPSITRILLKYSHNIEMIQRSWRYCNLNPEHILCQRRIAFECKELNAQ